MDCTSDAVATSQGNQIPKGLTFSNTGDTTAALTGSFGSPGSYEVTYTVTDTAIANGAYQTADTTSTVSVTFTLMVNPDLPPVLDPQGRISASGLVGRAVEITLPEALYGDNGLTDSLSGTHRPVGTGTTATAVTVDATSGAISLSGGGASGLTFNKRTGDGIGNEATITGLPTVTGRFSLKYKVVDGDDNEVDCIGVSTNDPSGCDTVTREVQLDVGNPPLTLGDGVADGTAVVLKQGVRTDTTITLPHVTSGASATANLSYVLTSDGTAVAGGAAALPGLLFTEDSRTLGGTPSMAGTWTLTYTVTDNNGDANAGNDVVDSITFTIQVVADSVPTLATALDKETFKYVTGVPVDEDSTNAIRAAGDHRWLRSHNGESDDDLHGCQLRDSIG